MLVVLRRNPRALAGNTLLSQRYEPCFGGRWQSFAESDETRRARELELRDLDTLYYTGRARVRWHLDRIPPFVARIIAFWRIAAARDRPVGRDFLAWLGAAGLEGVEYFIRR